MNCAKAQAVLTAFGLSFAQLEFFFTVDAGTWDSARKSLGQLVWRRVHWGCRSTGSDARMVRGCRLGLRMETDCSRQVLKLYTCLSMNRIWPLFVYLVFLPMKAL